MLLLDLRWVLFCCLLAVTVAVLLAVWLGRWRRERQEVVLFDPAGVRAVLERASFGWLVLDGPRAYRYANPYARRLLELTSPDGLLPDAAWVPLLEQDREAARREVGAMGRYRSVSLPSDQVARWWVTPWNDLDVVVVMEARPETFDR